jgi:hypothetical protein
MDEENGSGWADMHEATICALMNAAALHFAGMTIAKSIVFVGKHR